MEKKQILYRYGCQAFWMICALLVVEMLLTGTNESFAAIPETMRIFLILEIGLGYLAIRSAMLGILDDKRVWWWIFCTLWVGICGIRVAETFLWPDHFEPECLGIFRLIFSLGALLFLACGLIVLVRFLRQRK